MTWRLVSLFFVLAAALPAVAATSWSYTDYPELRAADRKTPAPRPRLAGVPLKPLRAPHAATHRGWRVEQVYVSPALDRRVFVKENVKLSSRRPIGAWLKIARGHVYHLEHRGRIVAYYAEGLTPLERTELQKSLAPGARASAGWTAFVPPARAELADPGGGETIGPAVAPAGGGPCTGDISRDRDCLLEHARRHPRPAGGGARLNARSGGASYWSCAGSMLDGAWEATVGSVVGAAQYVWSWFRDPGEAWSETAKSFEESVDFVLNFRERIAESIEGFMDLDPEIRDELVCSLLGQIGAAGLMTAAISWTGVGAAAGTARVVEMIKSFIGRVKPAMRGLAALSKLKGRIDLRADNVRQYLRELVRGEVDSGKIDLVNKAAERHPDLVPQLLDNLTCGADAATLRAARRTPTGSCGGGLDNVLLAALENSDGQSKRFERAMGEIIDVSDTPRPRYTVNDGRHGPQADGNPAASQLPANARDLFEQSVPYPDGGGRLSWWAVEKRGSRCVYHRFQGTNGEVHWNGSTEPTHDGGLVTRPGDVPESVKAVLSTYAQCRN